MATPGPVVVDEPVRAWKRAQVLLHPGTGEVRFAGPVHFATPYRSDEVFRCPAGHRRVEPSCSCGFYAVPARASLAPSVVVTAVLAVALEGRVVRHHGCLRAERQRVESVALDPWCAHCTAPAAVMGGLASAWGVPVPWLRGVPLCEDHGRLVPLVRRPDELAAALEARVAWDDVAESRAARSLRRLYAARSRALG